jgi:GNAT superfamily N-acetyltransferase
MVTLRAQRTADVPGSVALARRSWKDVEEAVDQARGSPLDRLVAPSWDDHHEAVILGACRSPASSVAVAEDDGEVEVIAVHPVARGRG